MNKTTQTIAWGGWLPAGLIVLGIALLIPFKNAMLFGGDDGMELGKALQFWGPSEWRIGMWNDQPPLFSWILAGIFKLCGPEAWAARLISCAFLLILLVAIERLLPLNKAPGSGLLAMFIVLAIDPTCELGFSVMQELPCMALAFAAFAWIRHGPWSPGRFLVSGILFGAAIGIKFVALLLFPAGIAMIVMLAEQAGDQHKMLMTMKRAIKWIFWWISGIVAAVVFVLMASGQFEWSQLWLVHRDAALAEPARQMAFPWHAAYGPWWLWLLLIAGTVVVARRRRWADLVFPWVALATVTLVHSLHRPWWSFYHIHFAIPLALWAGICWEVMWNQSSQPAAVKPLCLRGGGWPLWGALASVSIVLAGGLRGFGDQVKLLRRSPGVEGSTILPLMRQYAANTHWVFTADNNYAFHAKLPIPPNLLILSKKRFWTGQMDESSVLRIVQQYHPEQLVLSEDRELQNPEWRKLVEKDYVQVAADGYLVLFVHHRLNPVVDKAGKPQQANLLRSLRLTERNRAPLQPAVDSSKLNGAIH